MDHVTAVFKSKLLSPILLTALTPLSFRSSTSGTSFVFLGGGSHTMVAIALWATCLTLVVVAIVGSRHKPVRSQT